MTSAVSIEQAIRIGHCSNTGKEHACVGECTISANGVSLSCRLCGTDKQQLVSPSGNAFVRAKEILNAAGIDIEKLNISAQVAVVKAVKKDLCPNCGQNHSRDPYRDFFTCGCGWLWNGRDWKAGIGECK